MIKQKKSVSPSQTPRAPAYSDDHRLRAIAELTPDAFLIFDISGKVHYWNEAAAGMYGYSREEISEKSAFCLLPQRLQDENLKGLDRLLCQGPDAVEKKRIETFALRKDGSEFPIAYSNACWKEGETMLIGAIVRDISEQRRIAEERDKAHKDASWSRLRRFGNRKTVTVRSLKIRARR